MLETKRREIQSYLRKVGAASGRELSEKFSLGPRRLRDYLQSLGCLTSYSHKRAFYTLPTTPKFGKQRVWKSQRTGARFTDLGSLGALVEWHVRHSPSGLTCRQLSQIIDIRVEPQIIRISRECGLRREKFGGEFVYFYRANEKLYRAQVTRRGRESPRARTGPESMLNSEIEELKRDLHIAVALLNHPRKASGELVQILRTKGVRVVVRDLSDFVARYEIKKKYTSLEVTLLDILGVAARLQSELRARGVPRSGYCLALEPEPTDCPSCANALHTVKTTRPRVIQSIRFGQLCIKEKLKSCQVCVQRKVWRPRVPELVVPPKRRAAYDVMVFAGEQKLLGSQTLSAIRTSLAKHYGLSVSLSLLSLYVQEFCYRYECLHYAKLAKLAQWTKKEQLGYMLHVDCSSEHKSDTVFVAYDRTSEIVLISEKIPSERIPFLVPVLQKVKGYMGEPISTMSDLGLPILKAIEEVFPDAERRVCHFHFLRDVGKDILETSYDNLRRQLNQSKINAKLNALERDILSTHCITDISCLNVEGPLLRCCSRKQYAELEPALVLYFIRACRKLRSSTGLGYPFDLPWVRYAEELRNRAQQVQNCLEFLRKRRIQPRLLNDLNALVSPFLPAGSSNESIQPTLRRCLIREKQLEELRRVIRLFDKRKGQAPLSSAVGVASYKEIVKFNKGLRQYKRDLRLRLSSKGDEFRKAGYQVILDHIEKYWGSLVLHPSLWRALRCQVVDRTNNLPESGHRSNKQVLRKANGRRRIEQDYCNYGPYLPMISNLKNSKYVERILGETKNLPLIFAQLDPREVAHYREKFLEAKHGFMFRAVRAISQAQLL